MPLMDFDALSRLTNLPDAARRLLSRPEEARTLMLSIRALPEELFITDCYVVYYNTARGVAKGGIRIAPDVTLQETANLAELMVWKTALAGIPFGGGKSSIRLDPHRLTTFEKTAVMKEYVHLLRADLFAGNYVPAPDMGTSPREMAVIFGELHVPQAVTGKPPSVGGLPGRREATGRGVATSAALAAQELLRKSIAACTVAIQGFGNVGSYAGHFLCRLGARVVAASHRTGGLYNSQGIDVPRALALSGEESFAGLPGDAITNEELLALPVDILIPAAAGGAITRPVAERLRARLIVEGANDPVTADADPAIEAAGIPDVPDILANAGGVIASYIEWRNAKSGAITSEEEVYEFIDQVVSGSFRRVLDKAKGLGISLRRAAQVLALEEVVTAMRERGWL